MNYPIDANMNEATARTLRGFIKRPGLKFATKRGVVVQPISKRDLDNLLADRNRFEWFNIIVRHVDGDRSKQLCSHTNIIVDIDGI